MHALQYSQQYSEFRAGTALAGSAQVRAPGQRMARHHRPQREVRAHVADARHLHKPLFEKGVEDAEVARDHPQQFVARARHQVTLALAREAFGAAVMDPRAILDTEADIPAMCAVGAILSEGSIARLRVAAVAGEANN